MRIPPKFLKVGAAVLALLLVGGGAFYGGVRYGAAEKSIKITESRELIDADFSLFWEGVDLLKSRYVGIGEVKDQDLLYGAIRGVVDALGDPYSSFMNPSDAKKFDQDLAGSFGGIGAEIGIRNEQLVIVSPLKGNPAEAAGLKPNDKILKVDEMVTANLSVEEAVKLIRGDPGTKVRLLIFRDGWKETKEFTITRQIIVVPTLDTDFKTVKVGGREETVAHFHLHNFNSNVPPLFYQAVLQATLRGARGVVLDLRSNPGGFLDVATHLAGWFVRRGEVVVKERLRGGEERPFFADGNAALVRIPVVVLVNAGSASAAEIVAGALRDLRGAKLVGEKTFGKGSVQEMERLKDGSTIKVSIAEWVTPKGTRINEAGLTPDVEVKAPEGGDAGGADPQLEKALEILGAELAKAN